MSGEFVVIEQKVLVAVATATFNIGTARDSYFVRMGGSHLLGGSGENFIVRLNGDSAANYKFTAHNFFQSGTHTVASGTGSGIGLGFNANSQRGASSLLLERVGAGWVGRSSITEVDQATGNVFCQDSGFSWTFNVAVNTITVAYSGGAGAGRFTGTVTLYGRA